MGTCLVTLTENTTVSAVFTEDISQHTLTVITDGTGNGIVASNPDGILCGENCTEPFDDGTPIMLGAASQSGSTFTGWSGGGCSGTDPCEVTMTADTIVTATFTLVHSVIVEKSGAGTGTVIANGIDCGVICENTYDKGTGLMLDAIPDGRSTFAGWQVNGVPSGCVVVIDGPTTVTAIFE
jgi:hypothetical protein